ncbi:MAG: hypothetical protein PVI43_00135 [Candidatus Bathyarchaeota archaeon]|jgi:hypothetical protein
MAIESTATVTTNVNVDANVDLTSQIMGILGDVVQSTGIWLPMALLVSIVLVQGIKMLLKSLIPLEWKQYRKFATFIIAYVLGFIVGVYFIPGDDSTKYAAFVGAVNPSVYFILVQYAVARNRIVLLSWLKMRPLKRSIEGELSLEDTQTFIVKQPKK